MKRTQSHLDDSATFAAFGESEKLLGQSDGLSQPVEHDGLEFSARWAGGPRKTDAADGVAEHVAEDGRERVARREVSVEARVLPVGHSGHDFALDVRHDVGPRLRFAGSTRRQQRPQVAWLDGRRHSPLLQP